MSSKLVCPHCKAEITDRIGTAVEEFGYENPAGEYFGEEYGDTLYHYCLECGKELNREITDKFFGYEEKENG